MTINCDINAEREAFESWHRKKYPDVEFKLLLGAYAVISATPRPHGTFAVNERWKAWLERANRASNPDLSQGAAAQRVPATIEDVALPLPVGVVVSEHVAMGIRVGTASWRTGSPRDGIKLYTEKQLLDAIAADRVSRCA